MRDIYLLGSCRTPIGRFNGALQGLPAPAMAAVCLRTALLRAGVDAGEVAEVLC
ncbi:MAG: acetyl-CoA C-acetyltransferase, partial [Armatimonadetes bacterium]|nr:acetyl-CoA C-acetyltransferase [Armatimonadota bacterium]